MCGPKDAPRACRVRLGQVLLSLGLRTLYTAPQMCVRHEGAPRAPASTSLARAAENVREQGQQKTVTPSAVRREPELSELLLILHTCSRLDSWFSETLALQLHKRLEQQVRGCVSSFDALAHIGVERLHKPAEHYARQRGYIRTLRPLDVRIL